MATLSSPTADDLLQNVRVMLNQPDPVNSFWTDEELLVWINEGIRRYFMEVVLHNEGQFTKSTDLDIAANVETIALPSDFFAVKALYRKENDGYQILSYQNELTQGYSTAGGQGSLYYPTYMFRANNVVIRPTPNFAETAGLKLEYIAFPETLISGGDVMTAQVSPIFRDMIEMYTVYKAKLKESLVNNVQMHLTAKDNLGDLFMAFKAAISERSRNPQYTLMYNPEGTS